MLLKNPALPDEIKQILGQIGSGILTAEDTQLALGAAISGLSLGSVYRPGLITQLIDGFVTNNRSVWETTARSDIQTAEDFRGSHQASELLRRLQEMRTSCGFSDHGRVMTITSPAIIHEVVEQMARRMVDNFNEAVPGIRVPDIHMISPYARETEAELAREPSTSSSDGEGMAKIPEERSGRLAGLENLLRAVAKIKHERVDLEKEIILLQESITQSRGFGSALELIMGFIRLLADPRQYRPGAIGDLIKALQLDAPAVTEPRQAFDMPILSDFRSSEQSSKLSATLVEMEIGFSYPVPPVISLASPPIFVDTVRWLVQEALDNYRSARGFEIMAEATASSLAAVVEVTSQETGTLTSRKPVSSERRVAPTRNEDAISIRSKTEAIRISKLLLAPIKEALEYDQKKHHNRPRPVLLIRDDPEYKEALQNIADSLTNFNKVIAKKSPDLEKAKASGIEFKKAFNRFLFRFADGLGDGLSGLITAAGYGVLYNMNIPAPPPIGRARTISEKPSRKK